MAWLYLPGVEDSNSDSPLRSELITEQSPTLKGNVRPLRSWLRTWNAGGWIRLLSGMTLQPSQAMSLAHSWITSTLSQRDSLASRGVPQESNSAQLTNDGSGLSSLDWFARYDPEASSWRTSQVSFLVDLNTYSETWPRSGSMRNGQVFERQTLVRPIAGSESLSSQWTTIRAEEGSGYRSDGSAMLGGEAKNWATPVGHDHKSEKSTLGRSLGREAHQWQTPAAYLGKTRNPDGHKGENLLMLPGQAENWATPTTQEIAHHDMELTETGRRASKDGTSSHSVNLEDSARRWATPTARDYKDGSNPSDKVPTNAQCGRQAPRTPMLGNKSMNNTSLRLNPKFVEWLMGWPEGWVGLTNSESSATE